MRLFGSVDRTFAVCISWEHSRRTAGCEWEVELSFRKRKKKLFDSRCSIVRSRVERSTRCSKVKWHGGLSCCISTFIEERRQIPHV